MHLLELQALFASPSGSGSNPAGEGFDPASLWESLPMPCVVFSPNETTAWGNRTARRLLDENEDWVEQLRQNIRAAIDGGEAPTSVLDLTDCGRNRRYVFEEILRRDNRSFWMGWDSGRSSFVRGMQQIELVARKLAHEIKNPLQPIRLLVEEFQETHPDAAEETKTIIRQLDRIHHVLAQFKRFSDSGHIDPAPTDLLALLKAVIEDQKPLCGNRIRLDFHPGAALPALLIDRMRIGQVLTNLLQNSVEAMPDGGLIRIATGLSRAKNQVIVEIFDTGPGIAPAILNRLFIPFATTKPKGTGLGLVISRQIVQMHGGDLILASQEGFGTTATIFLPCPALSPDSGASNPSGGPHAHLPVG